VAQKLLDLGFSNVQALLGGYAAWQQAGLPTETSTP
jgi:rhodanese-related sulfurtransferase